MPNAVSTQLSPPWPPSPKQVAALAALSNLPYMERVRDALVSERQRLFEGLQAQVPYLQPFPSHSNFVLCKVGARRVWAQHGRGDARSPPRAPPLQLLALFSTQPRCAAHITTAAVLF